MKGFLGLDPFGEWSTVGLVVAGNTVGQQTTILTHGFVVLQVPLGESPLAGDGDLLATRKLELGTTESLDDVLLVLLLDANRQDDLANCHSSHSTERLAEGATHSGLKSISTGARQHFVYAKNMEGVHTNSHVERILAARFHLRRE